MGRTPPGPGVGHHTGAAPRFRDRPIFRLLRGDAIRFLQRGVYLFGLGVSECCISASSPYLVFLGFLAGSYLGFRPCFWLLVGLLYSSPAGGGGGGVWRRWVHVASAESLRRSAFGMPHVVLAYAQSAAICSRTPRVLFCGEKKKRQARVFG